MVKLKSTLSKPRRVEKTEASLEPKALPSVALFTWSNTTTTIVTESTIIAMCKTLAIMLSLDVLLPLQQ